MSHVSKPGLSESNSVELLKQLEAYDFLLEQLQAGFSAGFYQLSRANYHNKDTIRGRYGSDYWDQTFKGTQFITAQGPKLARLPESQVLEILESEDESSSESDEKDEVLRKRKEGQSSERKKAGLKKRLPDPLLMFGGALSIPSSLRQCQSSFKGSIESVIELANCRRRIEELISNTQD
ncbi:Vma22p [Lachancea thermotolerans CBS 6340]|uniref:Vacuolar ATPase assembly protein VMA22 n=1 Tax=Lachancea thermotolerans (strain ATCC 56472 / CBS 6340 / NRRL Y-8284) TaxID=559295 RepID=C5DKT2_LACTC|nr:KLTH0F07282p [Lachancea thermotolerans CBS 6340]CAR24083.1 KLTH0F07282p [Lachancea thermotolerans CBS 6340]